MALSHKKQQQKKQKKQQKRKQHNKRGNLIPLSQCPIQDCLVHSEIWDSGIGTVCLTRRTQTGRFYLGNYLLDIWFLGVKDSFVREIDPLQISYLMESQPLEEKSPAYAKALIMASIEYGRKNGVEPNVVKLRNLLLAVVWLMSLNCHSTFLRR